MKMLCWTICNYHTVRQSGTVGGNILAIINKVNYISHLDLFLTCSGNIYQ